MNRIYPIFLVLIFIVFAANGQIIIKKGEPIICNVGSSFYYSNLGTSASTEAISEKTSDNRSTKTSSFLSTFEVTYFGFPPDAEAAVQKAIDIWASTLKSDIKIKIFANWTVNTTSPFNLAFVVPTEAANFPGAPFPYTYPITLAEKLAQKNINSVDDADIVATFNAGRTDWYLGTDGNAPSNKFDLVTIALHELGHGLGFTSTFFANTSIGQYGPVKIYDTYIQNGLNQLLVNNSAYPNGSSALKGELTGGSLTFKSQIAIQLNGDPAFPRLYAPGPYLNGSSISHLDESTYPRGTKNSLLTPFADFGEVNHNPGPLLKGIFYDMGWLYTYLKHIDLIDRESMTSTSFDLDVKSDTAINTTSGKLYYSYDGFITSNNIPLALSGKWSAVIPSPTQEKTISYYFTFSDIFNKVYRYPIDPTKYVQFFYGVDTKKPIIIHQPVIEILSFQKIVPITAMVTDNIGLQKVEVEYQVNSGALKKIVLSNTTGNTYAGQLDLTSEIIKGGDIVKYRIVATDKSSQLNVANSPSSDFYSLSVKFFATKTSYTSDLNNDLLEFYGDFSVVTPVGFTNGAIHTSHPYLKSTIATNVDISYLLLYPIQVKTAPSLLQFDEVVLVEPINDYVIVEGSKDNGFTWKPLTAAYDSRKNADWLTYYNNGGITAGTSNSIGTLNYYKANSIDLLATFLVGDVIFIRFRLNSNNAINAWGWAIDNLRINDTVTGLNEFVTQTQSVVAYPNPVENVLSIVSDKKLLSVSAYSMTGQKINLIEDRNNIDVSNLVSGVYLFRINFEDGSTQLTKVIKR